MTVGKNIKLFRINAGLKQKDLANTIGVKDSYLSTIESGKKEPSLTLLKKISSALGIPLSIFFWEETENQDQNTSEAKLKKLLLQLTAEIKTS
jgi:transcriptional regulator with XRE-family HTH domain